MKTLLLILVAATLVAGCSGKVAPSAPDRVDQSLVARHGVLHVPPETGMENQGRHDPWLVDDQGVWYDLSLSPGQEELANPAFSGRGITIEGDLEVMENVPVGANESSIRVSEYRFDEP